MADKPELRKRPIVLIIRDGWGYNPNPQENATNAAYCADTPVNDRLMANYPHTLVHTYGEYVGLPDGTMGNSEVGHQNIGAGRVVSQESVRLSRTIEEGSFFTNECFLDMIQFVKARQGKMHVMGLASNIGVHSLLDHLYGLLKLGKKNDLDEVYIHAFMDGRDSPPRSGADYIAEIEAKAQDIGIGKIASVIGRFYAMDRDSRWERVQKAYDCLRLGRGNRASSAVQAIADNYTQDITDEFVEPTCITNDRDEPLATIQDGDGVVFFNFRGDRPREITRAFVDPEFDAFDRSAHADICYVCMTEYDSSIKTPVAFRKPPKMKNILGSYLSSLGLTQFRCAETEKYPHVTFFFNDYRESPFPGEDRQIVPSPKVRTYDLKPEMSAYEVTDVALERLDSQVYDVMIVNYANPDMVGHTGDLSAAIKAGEVVDACVGKVLDKIKSLGGAAIVTADHGNFEKMADGSPDNPHTAHTVGDVYLIVVDDDLKGSQLRENGTLADIAPTLLTLLKLPQPEEMTGTSLIPN
ncbi:MAG: 2,3-bisphosphoglycerate-independent phosphoglycerate mutase [Planctomycetes bacterium]|nr:2,3-bisphosphoglycerate-independent phosphoglycerate mutase [Planctomycetota bacterium]